MKYLLVVAILSGGLLCAPSPAQSTSTTPANSGASQPQQSPSTTPQSQTVPSTPQTQQPTQPSMTPPNTPQNSGASQTAPAQGASASAATVHRVAPSSVIPVQLAKSIDAKKAKTGDEVVATVTQDMKSGNGDVIIPKDTQVIGHVTESQGAEQRAERIRAWDRVRSCRSQRRSDADANVDPGRDRAADEQSE